MEFNSKKYSKEINLCFKICKDGNSPGPDQITSEFQKNLPPNCKYYLEIFFNKILDTGKTLLAWSQIKVSMIYKKKGDILMPENYRGIALINNLTKMFTKILRNR